VGTKRDLSHYGKRVLRGIFGPKRDETEDWMKVLNEDLNNLYVSPNLIKMISSMKMRWARPVARSET
jgi:hypothetical protein